jgi:nucleoid DNA-binding protein
MNKAGLLKNLHNASRGNLFSIELPNATKEIKTNIEEMIRELEKDGKIKLREYEQREHSVFLHGIMKYASE